MKVEEFEIQYKDKGGLVKLSEMRALMKTRKEIADHFGVVPWTVSKWTEKYFGEQIDARTDRKEAMIASMVDFARLHDIRDFYFVFHGTEYYEEALSKCKEENLYVE
jgi:hypothetical protein